jgi:quercetin 2,3-dioxygenase
MKTQTPAIIYKSHLRGCSEDKNQRLLATFNFEGYNNPHRKPFGNLKAFNDEVLAAGYSTTRLLPEDTSCVIIPLTGVIEAGYNGNTTEILPDSGLVIPSGEITIKNSYTEDLVNFLYIEVKAPATVVQNFNFNLGIRNGLHTFPETGNIKGAIGIFDGRQEATYAIPPKKGLFAFVINGAFEIEGRLMEERDGLALWDIDTIEIEALSENAVVLLLETTL